MSRILLFGDGELWLDEIVMVLTKEGHDPVVCDTSECGGYIANKHVKAGFTIKRTTLREALLSYPDYKVEAWNNRIASQLRRLGVHGSEAKMLLQKLERSIDEIVEENVSKNDWLNGWHDYRDGDVMAIVNQPEKFDGIKEHTDLIELFSDLKNYDGTYRYKHLLFFNDWRYGTFVYDLKNPDRSHYIEHLTIPVMTVESFINLITKIIS